MWQMSKALKRLTCLSSHDTTTMFAWQTPGVTAREDAPLDDESDADPRSAIEKQSAVIDFLRSRVGSAALSARAIAAALSEGGGRSVDLRVESAVDAMVRANARVVVRFDEEMEALYEYAAKHEDVHDFESLATFVNRSPNGVVGSEVFDCYVGAERDVERAIVGGAVAAILDGTSRRVGLFPRGAPYFVALSGEARFRSDRALATTRDVSSEVRRGDAVGLWLRGERPANWSRVSSRVHASGHQPKRAERPLSVTSLKDMHSSNEYCDAFTAAELPLNDGDRATAEFSRATFRLVKHGCSNDVRGLWLETAAETPVDHAQLERKLLEANLHRGGGGAAARRGKRPGGARAVAADEGKKKRRINTRFQRLTNTHLIGTAIGDVLAAAQTSDGAESATGGTQFRGSAS